MGREPGTLILYRGLFCGLKFVWLTPFWIDHELLIPWKYCIAGYFCGVLILWFLHFKKNLYAEIKNFVCLTPFWIDPWIINPTEITCCMVTHCTIVSHFYLQRHYSYIYNKLSSFDWLSLKKVTPICLYYRLLSLLSKTERWTVGNDQIGWWDWWYALSSAWNEHWLHPKRFCELWNLLSTIWILISTVQIQ